LRFAKGSEEPEKLLDMGNFQGFMNSVVDTHK